METADDHLGRSTWQNNSPKIKQTHMLCFTIRRSQNVNELKLTIGSLNKPITSDVAMEKVEKESPTIPRTGGLPKHFSCSRNCSCWPLTIDSAALNPITSVAQLSYRLYPRVTLGSRLMFLLISSMAKAIVMACRNPARSKLTPPTHRHKNRRCQLLICHI